MRYAKHTGTRPGALLASALLWFGLGACADAGKPSGASGGSTIASNVRLPPGASTTGGLTNTLTTDFIPPGQALRGDGDADNPTDVDGNGDVDPQDGDSDLPTQQSYKFPDEDDKAIFDYGHQAGAAEGRAIAAFVRAYYGAAAVGNGVAACKMIYPTLAESVAEDYGQAPGPTYLRGTTCPAVITKLFAHSHQQLTEAITVVAVRVEGKHAQVVLSSRKMPSSHIFLERLGSSWKVEGLIGQSLP